MNGGYEGKITNAGAQQVQAPNAQPKSKTDTSVTTGKDLRSNAGTK